MNPQNHRQWIDDMLLGEISEADLVRLEAEMSINPALRQEFYQRLQLELLLEQEADSRPAVPTPTPRMGIQVKPAWIALALIATAACLVAGVLIASKKTNFSESNVLAESSEQSASGFGLLAGQSNAVWGDPTGMAIESLRIGSLLNGEPLRLRSGLVHLQLFSGVEVVIQGEADFTIESPMRLAVRSGKIRARVPEPAQGFVIETGSGEIVDLGTEFAVDVSETQSTVEVVEGQIELHADASNRLLVESGKTFDWNRDGTINASQKSIDAIGPAEFQQLIDRENGKQLERWTKQTIQLADDPRLVAHYLMAANTDSSRVLANQAIGNTGPASVGAIVACERSRDRWNRDRGALSFSPMGSRVRVKVPGDLHGITLYCWVRIQSVDRLYNSLFLTDGHQGREPHWQITQDGRLFFSVKRPDEEIRSAGQSAQRIFTSPSFWNESMDGRWTMLCTTYDVEKREVIHYVNAQRLSAESFDDEWAISPLRVGAASIGNWSEPMYRTDPHFVIRNLDGSMDEFAIFEGALSKDEITEIYNAGNPHD